MGDDDFEAHRVGQAWGDVKAGGGIAKGDRAKYVAIEGYRGVSSRRRDDEKHPFMGFEAGGLVEYSMVAYPSPKAISAGVFPTCRHRRTRRWRQVGRGTRKASVFQCYEPFQRLDLPWSAQADRMEIME